MQANLLSINTTITCRRSRQISHKHPLEHLASISKLPHRAEVGVLIIYDFLILLLKNQQILVTLISPSMASIAAIDAPLPRVTIQYCIQCKWLLRAAYVSHCSVVSFRMDLPSWPVPHQQVNSFDLRLLQQERKSHQP